MKYRNPEGEFIPIIILAIVNFIVYLGINIAQFADTTIIQYLALSRSTFLEAPWTVFTYMFTHQSFFHLLFNMVTLYFFGSFINRVAGQASFLTIYLVGGLVAGIFIILLSSPMSFTIGASGAVYALGGALAVIAPRLKVFVFPIPVPIPLWAAIAGGFVLMALLPNVSWQGHLGGLLFGLLAGWYLRKRIRVIR